MNLEYSRDGDFLIVKGLRDFSLKSIFTCGQCFRWDETENGSFRGVAQNKYAEFNYDEESKILSCKYVSENDFKTFWSHYFDLEEDYGIIKANLSAKDDFMKNATAYGYGIRILNQDPFETLISFIISANNNIPRIKKCVANLCKAFGEAIIIDGKVVDYSFPTPIRLANCTPDEISAATHAGYRCPYIVNAAAQYIDDPILPKRLKDIPYEAAKKNLMKYMGVGPKVADCILLFTGTRHDAFPVDVWMARIMNRLYFKDTVDRKEIEKLSCDYFGENAGIAQQYLFFYGREAGIFES